MMSIPATLTRSGPEERHFRVCVAPRSRRWLLLHKRTSVLLFLFAWLSATPISALFPSAFSSSPLYSSRLWSSNLDQSKSPSEKATSTKYVSPDLCGVNNGPGRYRHDLGDRIGIPALGGLSIHRDSAPRTIGEEACGNKDDILTREVGVSSGYRMMGVRSVRPNDLGGAFDINCMFPITEEQWNNYRDGRRRHGSGDGSDSHGNGNVSLPDPLDDLNWNWTLSDIVFQEILEGGFAPLLKIPTNGWVSGRLVGLSYQTFDDTDPTYVVPRKLDYPSEYGCSQWPVIAPIMSQIGSQLAVMIALRYNDFERWKKVVPWLTGPPLEADTWTEMRAARERARREALTGRKELENVDETHDIGQASRFSAPFVGIEVGNELDLLICGPPYQPNKTANMSDEEVYREQCGGDPFTWGAKYWDGSPQQAWEFLSDAMAAVQRAVPNVAVGGPGKFNQVFPQAIDDDTFSHTVTARALKAWVSGFIDTLRRKNVTPAFWSFHVYSSVTAGAGRLSRFIADARDSLKGTHLEGKVDLVISEWNNNFKADGTGYAASANGAIANSIHFMTMAREGIRAAYLLNGVDGAFLPYQPLSFPLWCRAEFEFVDENQAEEGKSPRRGETERGKSESKTGMESETAVERIIRGESERDEERDIERRTKRRRKSGPTSMRFTGTFQNNDCTTAPSFQKHTEGKEANIPYLNMMSLGPSGMGAMFPEGDMKPMASAFSMWKRLVGKPLLETNVSAMGSTSNVLAVIVNPEVCEHSLEADKTSTRLRTRDKGREKNRDSSGVPLARVLLAQYWSPGNSGSPSIEEGLSPLFDGLSSFIPWLTPVDKPEANQQPVLLRISELFQKPRGIPTSPAIQILPNVLDSLMHLEGGVQTRERRPTTLPHTVEGVAEGEALRNGGAKNKKARWISEDQDTIISALLMGSSQTLTKKNEVFRHFVSGGLVEVCMNEYSADTDSYGTFLCDRLSAISLRGAPERTSTCEEDKENRNLKETVGRETERILEDTRGGSSGSSNVTGSGTGEEGIRRDQRERLQYLMTVLSMDIEVPYLCEFLARREAYAEEAKTSRKGQIESMREEEIIVLD